MTDPADAAGATLPGWARAVEPLLAGTAGFADLGPGEGRGSLLIEAAGPRIHGLEVEADETPGFELERLTVTGADGAEIPANIAAAPRPGTWGVTLAKPVSDVAIVIAYRLEESHPLGRLRVTARGRWRSRLLYDRRERLAAWGRVLARGPRHDHPGSLALSRVIDLTARGDYVRAHRMLARDVEDANVRAWFRDAITDRLLRDRGIEWTTHGPSRPFRLWAAEERKAYVAASAAIATELAGLTPNVSLGFGSVLAAVRDHALIPHDDDIDLIVGFEPDEAPTIEAALARLTDHLRARGLEVSGDFLVHRHVRRPGERRVDVFVGIFEGNRIAWYPGPREGLPREVVFPAAAAELLGVEVRIPREAERYLEHVYGPGWSVPDPNFNHRWNATAFADLRAKGDQAAGAPAAGSHVERAAP